jgi:energy-coupling factor transporter ATP-binding protein EcfA2
LARAAFPRSIVVDRGAIVADGSTSEILTNRELLLTHGLA